MKNNQNIINLKEKSEGLKLKGDLDEIKLDLEMIHRHNKTKISKDYEKSLMKFMDIRNNMGVKFENWRNENLLTYEESLALWSYITEVYQNLLIPSIKDFDLGDGEILTKLDQALNLASALEGFHMTCMGSYINMITNKSKR